MVPPTPDRTARSWRMRSPNSPLDPVVVPPERSDLLHQRGGFRGQTVRVPRIITLGIIPGRLIEPERRLVGSQDQFQAFSGHEKFLALNVPNRPQLIGLYSL